MRVIIKDTNAMFVEALSDKDIIKNKIFRLLFHHFDKKKGIIKGTFKAQCQSNKEVMQTIDSVNHINKMCVSSKTQQIYQTFMVHEGFQFNT